MMPGSHDRSVVDLVASLTTHERSSVSHIPIRSLQLLLKYRSCRCKVIRLTACFMCAGM